MPKLWGYRPKTTLNMSPSTADHIEMQPIQRQFLNPICLMNTDTFIARSENITEQFQAGKVLHYLTLLSGEFLCN